MADTEGYRIVAELYRKCKNQLNNEEMDSGLDDYEAAQIVVKVQTLTMSASGLYLSLLGAEPDPNLYEYALSVIGGRSGLRLHHGKFKPRNQGVKSRKPILDDLN